MKKLLFSYLMLLTGCASNPLAPSRTPGPLGPIVLSGQSNAVFVEPYLRAAWPGSLEMVGRSGQPISTWNPEQCACTELWTHLVGALHVPELRAFIWWQGESDRENADYAGALQGLIRRVRAEAGNDRLFVVVVRVLDLPANTSVRAAQAAVVAADGQAVLISSDGFQDGSGDHLTAAGYREVSRRIVAALH